MRLSRRSVLRRGAALAAGLAVGPRAFSAPAAGDRARDEETAALLREFILQRASASTDPWIEMHVVLALGSGFEREGKNLLDRLVADILAVETVGLRRYPYFPLEIERHPFHMLQIMQATEVPYERVFVTPRGRFSRRDLVAGGTALLMPNEIDDELSWLVSVLTNEFPPDADRFSTARGETVVVEDIVRRHLKETEAAYADVFAVMKREKLYDKSPLHRMACNGTHLLYGLVDAVRSGYRTDDLKPRVERIVGATLFRTHLEPVLIDRSMAGRDPRIRLNRDAAKFTFIGHVVEILGFAHRHAILDLGPAALQAAAGLRAQLAQLTTSLTTGYDLDALREEVPQAYKLILGDACHAYRGLQLWS